MLRSYVLNLVPFVNKLIWTLTGRTALWNRALLSNAVSVAQAGVQIRIKRYLVEVLYVFQRIKG